VRTRTHRKSFNQTALAAMAIFVCCGPIACTWTSVTSIPFPELERSGAVHGRLRILHEKTDSPKNLGGTIVYLDAPGQDALRTSSENPTLVFGTKGRVEPELLAGHLGQRVRLSFLGDVLHEPFTQVVPGVHQPIEMLADGTLLLSLEEAGITRLYCSLHRSERAVIYVALSPFHTLVDSSGLYQIADVPPGEYRLRIWSEPIEGLIRPIEIEAGADLESTIWIDARMIAQ
jgi:hypothetical protein